MRTRSARIRIPFLCKSDLQNLHSFLKQTRSARIRIPSYANLIRKNPHSFHTHTWFTTIYFPFIRVPDPQQSAFFWLLQPDPQESTFLSYANLIRRIRISLPYVYLIRNNPYSCLSDKIRNSSLFFLDTDKNDSLQGQFTLSGASVSLYWIADLSKLTLHCPILRDLSPTFCKTLFFLVWHCSLSPLSSVPLPESEAIMEGVLLVGIFNPVFVHYLSKKGRKKGEIFRRSDQLHCSISSPPSFGRLFFRSVPIVAVSEF